MGRKKGLILAVFCTLILLLIVGCDGKVEEE